MSAQKICPTCNTEYPANERFCPRDGTALRSQGSGTDLVGSVIAERFHVLKKLGEGGMGQVYLAEHVKMGRRSAVKVMHPGMVHDADAIGRFNREAANASRINHPNVAGIYDFGETPEGLVYLAMEYIEGETLTDIVKAKGALPPIRAAEITRQAAEGLHVAHDMGIVHRDLKPDNIMVTVDRDGFDQVKVVDFGIAKSTSGDAQNVTRTGMVIGTPEYMSPEQLSGDKVDGKSDVYSLAIVAFNMLTGQLPFPSDTAQSSMIMRLTERPKTLTDMKPDTVWPEDVQAVMDRALERDASLRYQKARDFGRALFAAIEHMPGNASAGVEGTMVMATPAFASRTVPPRTYATGVAAAPAAATAPIAAVVAPPAKSKVPMMIGGALAAAALAGGFFFMGRGGTTAASVPTPTTTTVPTSTASPTPGTVVLANKGESSTTTAAVAAPRAPAASAEETAKKITVAFGHASKESTARKAIDETHALDTEVTTPDDKVFLALIRAQAYGTLGKDSQSCEELKAVSGISAGTRYEKKFNEYFKFCK